MEDVESLRQALLTLKQTAAELQQEWAHARLASDIESLETEVLEERTASELGVAGAAVLGLGVVNTTMKTMLPPKMAGQLVTGAWILGGALIVLRLTASTAAGWAAAAQRNARRKRALLRKLQDLQRRVDALAGEAAAGAAEPPAPPPPEAPPAPQQQGSPVGSAGSSAELVEAPGLEEPGAAGEGSTAESGGPPAPAPGVFDSWRRYATLGRRKSD